MYADDLKMVTQGQMTAEKMRDIYFGYKLRPNIPLEELEENSLARNSDPRAFSNIYENPKPQVDYSKCGNIFKTQIQDLEKSMAPSNLEGLKKSIIDKQFADTTSYAGSRVNRWIAQGVEKSTLNKPLSQEEMKLQMAYPFLIELDAFVKKTQAERTILRTELQKALKVVAEVSQDDETINSQLGSITKRLDSFRGTVVNPNSRSSN